MIRRDPVGPIVHRPMELSPDDGRLELPRPWRRGAGGVEASEITLLSTLRAAELLNDIVPVCIKRDPRRRGHNRGSIDQCAQGRLSQDRPPRACRNARQSKNPSCIWNWRKAPVIVLRMRSDGGRNNPHGSYFNAGQDCAQPCRVIAQKAFTRIWSPASRRSKKSKSAHKRPTAPKWAQSFPMNNARIAAL